MIVVQGKMSVWMSFHKVVLPSNVWCVVLTMATPYMVHSWLLQLDKHCYTLHRIVVVQTAVVHSTVVHTFVVGHDDLVQSAVLGFCVFCW